MDLLKRKPFAIICVLPAIGALIMFLSAPQKYAACVSEGISLWAVSVLPSVFPFLFLTAYLRKTRAFRGFSRKIAPVFAKTFRISGTGGGIFLLSVLSGYPVGARALSDSYADGSIGSDEIFRLSCLCSTTGPVFLVGVVGGAMLSNVHIGWALLLCHILAVVLVSIVLSAKAKAPRTMHTALSAQTADGGIYASVVSALCVGASIALFACFSQMAADILRLPEGGTITALLRGLFEMTTGCALFAQNPTRLSLCAMSFLTTFGGACVLFQQLAFLKPAGVKPLPFIAVKFLQGLVSALLFFGISFLFV